jgi:diguanylate cyclase (GGDEF)-like protein
MDHQIENWITPDPTTVEEGASLLSAIHKMGAKGIGAILITRGGALCGIFTERDLLRLFSVQSELGFRQSLEQPVESFMTRDPVTAQASEDYDSVYLKMKTHGVRHVPVLDGERLAGIVSMRDLIHFYQNKLESAFNEARQEVENLKRLVNVSENDKIDTLVREIQVYRSLSLTDHLTGLFNKRYFQARLGEEIARAARYGEQLSLIFCDIDHFKAVNDRFGHQSGDEVLRQTAQLLSGAMDELHILSRLRKSDVIARYGGEEFVIILPETGREGAAVAAEKLRRVVEEHPYRVDGEALRLTMSFGVAELTPGDNGAEKIIRNADSAMYQAKQGGRNRVAVHPD